MKVVHAIENPGVALGTVIGNIGLGEKVNDVGSRINDWSTSDSNVVGDICTAYFGL